jgi:hypothetical protein
VKDTGVELPAAILILVGENVPPAPLSEGVNTTVEPTTPLGVTVKLIVEPTTPVLEAETANDVADVPPLVEAAVNEIGDPVFVNPLLLEIEIDFAPLVAGI